MSLGLEAGEEKSSWKPWQRKMENKLSTVSVYTHTHTHTVSTYTDSFTLVLFTQVW